MLINSPLKTDLSKILQHLESEQSKHPERFDTVEFELLELNKLNLELCDLFKKLQLRNRKIQCYVSQIDFIVDDLEDSDAANEDKELGDNVQRLSELAWLLNGEFVR